MEAVPNDSSHPELDQVVDELEHSEFAVIFRGYDPREVRTRLAQISATLRQVRVSATDAEAARALRDARGVAERLVVQARDDAAQTLKDAEVLAEETIAAAEQVIAERQRKQEADLNIRMHNVQAQEAEMERLREQTERELIRARRQAVYEIEQDKDRRVGELRQLEEELKARQAELEDVARLREERELELDQEMQERRARASQEIEAASERRMREVEKKVSEMISSADESLRSTEAARARAEEEVRLVFEQAEASRRASEEEIARAREELEAARRAIADAESSREMARRRWSEETGQVLRRIDEAHEVLASARRVLDAPPIEGGSPAGGAIPAGEDPTSAREA